MNKKGLGRGLESLFGNFEDGSSFSPTEKQTLNITPDDEKQAKEIAVSLIDNNENQPRKKFDEKSLNELAQSVKNYGIIQPLVLTKRGQRYLIVAGERRWRAAKIAGLKTVPAIIKDLSDQDVREVALVENLQRENLNAVEGARAIQELIEKHSLTQEKIADKIGKSRSAVANTLRLLTLAPEVLEMIENDTITSGHARPLIVLEDKKAQVEIAKMAKDGKASVRQVEKFVKEFLKPKAEKTKAEQSLELKGFAKRLQDVFSTKVTILGNDKKGRIFIDYYSQDDLDRINALVEKLSKPLKK